MKLAPGRLPVAQTSVCALVPQPADRLAHRHVLLHPERFARRASAHPQRPVHVSLPHRITSSFFSVNPTESYSFARITRKPNRILLFHQHPGGTPYHASYYSQSLAITRCVRNPHKKDTLCSRKPIPGSSPSPRSGESSDSHPAFPSPAAIPQLLAQERRQSQPSRDCPCATYAPRRCATLMACVTRRGAR
jgi:hypothetical protein